MNLLIDTHVILWFVTDNEKLPSKVKYMILDNQNLRFVSLASFWEISIKYSLGKLDLDVNLENFFKIIQASGFEILSINESHILKSASLEFYHQDPFDRMIIAQALVEDYTIVTKDQYFKEYNPKLIWD